LSSFEKYTNKTTTQLKLVDDSYDRLDTIPDCDGQTDGHLATAASYPVSTADIKW